MINPIISECSKVAKRESKSRYAYVVKKVIHKELFKKLKSDHTN